MKYSLIALRDLLKSNDEQSVKDILNKFSCQRNKDVENFLCKKAIDYLKLNLARTFIYINHEKLDQGEFEIAAYFAIGAKSIDFGSAVSKTRRKKLNKTLKKDTVICYLIGQIGKNDNADNGDLYLSDILDDIYIQFNQVIDAIGGQLILIECYEDELIELYEKHGFHFLQKTRDNNNKEINQLVRKTSDITILDVEDDEIYDTSGRHNTKTIGLQPIRHKRKKTGFGSRSDKGRNKK